MAFKLASRRQSGRKSALELEQKEGRRNANSKCCIAIEVQRNSKISSDPKLVRTTPITACLESGRPVRSPGFRFMTSGTNSTGSSGPRTR